MFFTPAECSVRGSATCHRQKLPHNHKACILHIPLFTLTLRFFQTNGEMKGLFPKIITISEENRLEFVIDEKMLQKHATTVMEGLGAAVESLNNPYVLDNVLKAVGQTHARRQVKPIMLKVGVNRLNLITWPDRRKVISARPIRLTTCQSKSHLS